MKLFRGLERDGSKGMRREGRHSMYYAVVTRSRVWLLATQKPSRRQGWWKGKFDLFWMPAASGEGGRLSKGRSPISLTVSGQEQQSIGSGRGLRAEKHSQLWQSFWNWSMVVWPALSWLFWVQLAQTVKNLSAMRETWVQSLGWEDPLEEGMAT